MTVLDMILATIKEKGYDGLYNSDAECACSSEEEIAPCGGESFEGCKFGHYVSVPDWADADWFIGDNLKEVDDK